MPKPIFRKIQFDKRGFSLIETVVSVGLVGGLLVAVGQQNMGVSQSLSANVATGEYLDLNEQISQLLGTPGSCGTTLAGTGTSPIVGDQVTLLADGTPPATGGTQLPVLYNSDNTVLITAGQNFGKILIQSIQLVPLTPPLPAEKASSSSQYSKLFITLVSDIKHPEQIQNMSFGITIIKDSKSNSLISCTNPQPWTGSVLGLSQGCPTDSALTWDGVSFNCKKIQCPLNTIQNSIDANNSPVCTSLSSCPSSTGPMVPTQALVYRASWSDGSVGFVCRGVVCPVGSVSNSKDSDGFISSCGPLMKTGH
jgi:type II secretory pathway pseudopilin PulG